MFAVIRIRAPAQSRKDVDDTLQMLRLTRVNHCVIVPENASTKGMLQKAKDFIAWGTVSSAVVEQLVAKRGRLQGDKRVPAADVKKIAAQIEKGECSIKPVFRLSPPSKGYKATKMHWPRGDLGNRGDKINQLLERML